VPAFYVFFHHKDGTGVKVRQIVRGQKKKFLCCLCSGENNMSVVKIAGFIFLSFPPLFVIPAKAEIHNDLKIMDFRLHGNDYSGYLQQNSKVSKQYGILIAFFMAIRY
jgi:hypothetical protein